MKDEGKKAADTKTTFSDKKSVSVDGKVWMISYRVSTASQAAKNADKMITQLTAVDPE